jgi:regulator of protease activity HflC (stomatin/prohibitin superfamily)
MRQAADILASPAAMQIRQLEALQHMAKSSNSKVIFVPMQLQNDLVNQLGSGSGVRDVVQAEAGETSGIGAASRAGLLSSVAEIS